MKGLYIVTGPSGAGKSTLCRRVIDKQPDLAASVSHTTRTPRSSEQEGVHYHFVEKPAFGKMIDEDHFAEWTQIHGNYYGSSHAEVEKGLSGEGAVIFELEGHGALQIKAKYPQACTIFVLPPSLDALRKRLEDRAQDAPDEIERRLQYALTEIQYVEQFEYVLVNEDFEQAVRRITTILRANTFRRHLVWPDVADRFRE